MTRLIRIRFGAEPGIEILRHSLEEAGLGKCLHQAEQADEKQDGPPIHVLQHLSHRFDLGFINQEQGQGGGNNGYGRGHNLRGQKIAGHK